MKRGLKIISAILALLLLAGCARGNEAANNEPVRENVETTVPVATLPPQQVMPQAELQVALDYAELALLSAAIDETDRQNTHRYYTYIPSTVMVLDQDNDGRPEMLTNGETVMFSLAPTHCVAGTAVAEGYTYYIDNAGNFYRNEVGITESSGQENGKSVWIQDFSAYYEVLTESGWQSVYTYTGTAVYTQVGAGDYDWENPRTTYKNVTNHGTETTYEELEAHWEQIGLDYVRTTPADYMHRSYDSVYAQDLAAQLDRHLAAQYDSYSGMIRQDIDDDGVEETLFLIPGFDRPWLANVQMSAEYVIDSILPQNTARTGILIADVEGDSVKVSALCALGDFYVSENMSVTMDGCVLWLDGTAVYRGLLEDQGKALMCQQLGHYLSANGYANCFFREADLSDHEENEYLCLGQKNGVWYVLVFVIRNGGVRVVYSQRLEDSALYLVEVDGQQCLMRYSQYAYLDWRGKMYHYYGYDVQRFNAHGQAMFVDMQSDGYFNDTADASSMAAFFQQLNGYLVKVIVIMDPFCLTGSVWMDPSEAVSGSVPQEENPSQQEETQMGFVQIKNPSSWLNLREGPGTNYPCVQMDPSDPTSIVKQALGSPVTILETIETGDPVNPVWVKIRIVYQNREVVGYSSKTYIRIPGED